MKKVLITGAAGKLGGRLRTALADSYDLRLTDIVPLSPQRPGEDVVTADLAEPDQVFPLAAGVEAIVHFGGIGVEDSFEAILRANIIGTRNVYEAALRAGVRRVIYASSIHACGMYPRGIILDAETPARPDSYYGLSKAYGENIARLHYDKHGIEGACLRIGSCFDRPTDERHLATWLSFGDMARLVRACIDAPFLGFATFFGMSANTRSWWSNAKLAHVGYVPQDNAEDYADEVLAKGPVDPRDPDIFYQGGFFVSQNGSFTRDLPG